MHCTVLLFEEKYMITSMKGFGLKDQMHLILDLRGLDELWQFKEGVSNNQVKYWLRSIYDFSTKWHKNEKNIYKK